MSKLLESFQRRLKEGEELGPTVFSQEELVTWMEMIEKDLQALERESEELKQRLREALL